MGSVDVALSGITGCKKAAPKDGDRNSSNREGIDGAFSIAKLMFPQSQEPKKAHGNCHYCVDGRFNEYMVGSRTLRLERHSASCSHRTLPRTRNDRPVHKYWYRGCRLSDDADRADSLLRPGKAAWNPNLNRVLLRLSLQHLQRTSSESICSWL